jgi:hypothetical protein
VPGNTPLTRRGALGLRTAGHGAPRLWRAREQEHALRGLPARRMRRVPMRHVRRTIGQLVRTQGGEIGHEAEPLTQLLTNKRLP